MKLLLKILAWLWSIWKGLPGETKAQVIKAFVDGLERLIRSYYREAKAT